MNLAQITLNISLADSLTPAQKAEIICLCTAAYAENFDNMFEMLPGSMHMLACLNGELVSHAAWVTRWLQPAGCACLRTAYVEAVATAPVYQHRGFATAVLRELQAHIGDYDLGGLSPSDAGFYMPLGWELWRGPLAIRMPEGLLPTPPDEQVMILRLAHTPDLDLDTLLTAEWRNGELW